jgi:Protein of unknown function (DUF2797)
VLTWFSPAAGERERPLPSRLALTGGGGRSCVGVRRAGRRVRCPAGAGVAGEATSGQCPSCAAVDRSYSVAADTALDDQRVFRLYLAWFGPGLLKLGITAAERGHARLLEQGALAHTWLGEGRLPAVRRAERVLGAALGIPDRVGAAAKRRALAGAWPLPGAAEDLATAHEALATCPAWPDTLSPLPLGVADHRPAYGLDGSRPVRATAAVRALRPGATIAGTASPVVGKDAYVTGGHGLLILDLRLLAGWELTKAPAGTPTDTDLRPLDHADPQDALF